MSSIEGDLKVIVGISHMPVLFLMATGTDLLQVGLYNLFSTETL